MSLIFNAYKDRMFQSFFVLLDVENIGCIPKLHFNKNSFSFTPPYKPYKGDKKNFITIE